MLKRGLCTLFIGFILIILVSALSFAQDAETTPTPEATLEENLIEEEVGEDENINVDENRDEKIKVCHISGEDREKANTLEISENALDSHLGHGDYEGECEEDENIDVDEELGGAGITPDSIFYFFDELFDRFGNCIDNREEKVAEIKEMVNAGKIKEAKDSLRKYEKCADEVEREVSPDEKEHVKRSARAIRKVIRSIEKDIPEEDKEAFRDIIGKEQRIEKAAEIALKIKDLCVELSRLDVNEYARVCRTKDDAPKWQLKLDEDLTEEQKNAARKFVGIMSQCFRTQGMDCRCSELEEINRPFADRCSIVAPLAAKCDKGDERACEAMDDATEGIEDTLPDYLLEVFEDLEQEVEKYQFEFHMPQECRAARVSNAGDCMKIMFEANAPQECREALERGEIDFNNEREARESCEEIMFRENAPQECIEAGLKDPRECGGFMFKQNAPQECIEAGLTGDNRDDPRKCEKIMRELGGEHMSGRREFNVDCKKIQDPEDRLRCYDNALEGVGEFRERGEGDHGGWPPPCQEAQAFTRDSCERIMNEWGATQRNYEEKILAQRGSYQDYYKKDFEERFKETMERERACVERCSSEGKAWTFAEGQCICFGGDRERGEEDRRRFEEERRRAEEEFRRREAEFRDREGTIHYEEKHEEKQQPPFEGEREPTTTKTEGSETEGAESEQTSGEAFSGGETIGTGAVIVGDGFLDYYFS